MSTPLRAYRIYCLDVERRIVSGDWLEAADDDDAIARAEAMDVGGKCEIWEGDRRVAQIEQERLQA